MRSDAAAQSCNATSGLPNKKPQRGVLEDVFVVMCAQVHVTMVVDMIMNSIQFMSEIS